MAQAKRLSHKEKNRPFLIAGFPFEAFALAAYLMIVFVLIGGYYFGVTVGFLTLAVLRKLLKKDPALLDWLLNTMFQEKSYGPWRIQCITPQRYLAQLVRRGLYKLSSAL